VEKGILPGEKNITAQWRLNTIDIKNTEQKTKPKKKKFSKIETMNITSPKKDKKGGAGRVNKKKNIAITQNRGLVAATPRINLICRVSKNSDTTPTIRKRQGLINPCKNIIITIIFNDKILGCIIIKGTNLMWKIEE
jgi:hypothetical protein